LGLLADTAIGKHLDEVAQNPLAKRLTQMISEANMTTGTKTFEIRDEVAHKDFVVNVAVLHQDDPDTVGYVIALYDVTSLKDLNRLKTHMIKMASHDLKSPLGVLLGYVDLLWHDVSSNQVPQSSYIEALYKSITRMETLIASLLDAHRTEDDAFSTVAIDPYDLFQTVLDDIVELTAQRDHQIIKNIQPNLHPIKGDFVQLREAMNNLLSNAVKYTPDGGTITINIYTEEDRFYFTVKDTGYGIPADQQPHIFETYFRAPATSHIGGTGVGLSLVKEVIERHGGQVWFTSEEGHGSTFGFWLPLLDNPLPENSA
jgi:signal transduction histidine kinase